MAAVFPSAEMATDCTSPTPTPPVPTRFAPCWLQVPFARTYTQAVAGTTPPTIAVLPSADSATDAPWADCPDTPEPINFGPC